MKHLITDIRHIFQSALKSVQPQNLFQHKVWIEGGTLWVENHSFHLSKYKNIYVIGFGKASAYMASALDELLGDRIKGGAVIVKYRHSVSCRFSDIYEAGHPVPDENTLNHSKRIIEVARKAGESDLVLCLISGGGSSLFEILPRTISLEDLQEMNALLLSSGAEITEMNALRKHISKVKGGKLLRSIYPATCVSLIISDILHDPPDSIASGPTAADMTTFRDAQVVLHKYALERKIPASILSYIERGVEGKISETVKEGEPALQNVSNFIIGNIDVAMNAAKQTASQLGYESMISFALMRGEASEMGESIVQILRQYSQGRENDRQPLCMIFGGETTVTLGKQSGRGGRNQELALSALLHMKDFEKDFVLISAGTDGTDGPTDAAGAIITRKTLEKAESLGLDPEQYLREHNAYPFFEQTGSLLKTGPTGTNVMDLVIALVK
ncbi:MAG: glycerate kinase type-2 family protein [Bacteroidota bacterium]